MPSLLLESTILTSIEVKIHYLPVRFWGLITPVLLIPSLERLLEAFWFKLF